MIAVIDYGMGNLRSVENAFAHVGEQAIVTGDPKLVECADGVVLPGVGAFGDAMFNLRQIGMLEAIKRVARQGKPLLGICLGMQLLFSMSEEHGTHVGIGLIPGHVKRFRGNFKIPHVGWNDLRMAERHPLLEDVKTGDYVYFVHSYYVQPMDTKVILAATDYNGQVPAIVGRGNVFGIQFHPEKSGAIGLRMLENFAGICRKEVVS